MRNAHLISGGIRPLIKKYPVFLLIIFFVACERKKFDISRRLDKLFTLVPQDNSGIHFANNLHYSEHFNPYTCHYFFNAGGVAVGDINNDGMQDIFFYSNQGDNKLYLNKGNFQFEDISQRAGIYSKGLWSTGATFADVNRDGLQDI